MVACVLVMVLVVGLRCERIVCACARVWMMEEGIKKVVHKQG